jgi:hypothetical protein
MPVQRRTIYDVLVVGSGDDSRQFFVNDHEKAGG